MLTSMLFTFCKESNTVVIQVMDLSGFQMVQSCQLNGLLTKRHLNILLKKV